MKNFLSIIFLSIIFLLLFSLTCFAEPLDYRTKKTQTRWVCIEIATGKIVSFGGEDCSRYSNDYALYNWNKSFPDEMEFCRWDGEKVIVDQTEKDAVLVDREKERKIEAEVQKLTREQAIQSLIDKGEIEP